MCLPMLAGDTVSLCVEHPVYGKAEAVQICPAQQSISVQIDSISSYGEVYGTMSLPGYIGCMTDVQSIVVRIVHCTARRTMYYTNDTIYDTVIMCEEDRQVAALYSTDAMFGTYHDLLTPSPYYAGYMLNAPVQTAAHTFPFVMDMHIMPYNGRDNGTKLTIDSLTIAVHSIVRTADNYAYRTSLRRVLDQREYVQMLTSSQSYEENDIGMTVEDIIAVIGEMFDELGQAEENQVYHNLSGNKGSEPLGCFSLISESETICEIK